MSQRKRTTCLLGGCLTLLGPVTARPAANTITTLVEDDVVNGNCTLREALRATIVEAAVDQCAGDVGPDTILLDAVGTYEMRAGNLGLSARSVTVVGDPDHPKEAYVIDLGGQQRFLLAHSGSDLAIENLTLVDGWSDSFGGALSADNSNLRLLRVRIEGSLATSGGAVSYDSDTAAALHVEDVELVNNQASVTSGGFFRFGGALYAYAAGNSSVRLVNVRFLQNAVVRLETNSFGYGGGAYVSGDDQAALDLRGLLFQDNVINTSSGAFGGGLYLENEGTGNLELEDVQASGNDSIGPATNEFGPALNLHLGASPASVRRLRVTGNGPSTDTAQILLNARFPTQVLLSDVLVADGNASGILLIATASGSSIVAGNLTVTNHSSDGLITNIANGGELRLENSIVFGNGTAGGTDVVVFNDPPDLSPENLIGVDPLFENPAAGDYRLAAGSLAVDAGDATFVSVGPWDTAHGARVVGVAVDLGAFERGAIFSDGFEEEDAYAWSAQAP